MRVWLLAVVLLLVVFPIQADRRDQVAADRYNEGVALIKKGRYREGATKIQEAVARGATEPNDQQGTESRYLARRYDPYYWLGVAQMEQGLSDQALANFEKSESIVPAGRSKPAIVEWREEYADLLRRKKLLLATLEASNVTAAPTPATAAPTRPPTLVLTLPTSVPASGPPAIPATIATSTTRITLAPTSIPVVESVERVALRTLREEWKGWLNEPKLGSAVSEPLGRALRDLDRQLAQPEKDASVKNAGRDEARRQLEAARARFRNEVAPLLRGRCLSLAVEALASRQWTEVEKYADRARKADPNAAQPDLLLCASNATRFILEGRKDTLRLEEARKFLRAWRSKVEPGKPTPRFLSPALREILS